MYDHPSVNTIIYTFNLYCIHFDIGNLTTFCSFLNIGTFDPAELSHSLFIFNLMLRFVNSLLKILFFRDYEVNE